MSEDANTDWQEPAQMPNGQRRRQRPAPMEGGLWDAQDVANFLRASRSWVYERAGSGELPCRRIGGLLRFSPDEIRAFADGVPVREGSLVVLPAKKES